MTETNAAPLRAREYQTLTPSVLGSGAGAYKRLAEIAGIIEAVDQRCMACDGPVTPTLAEMTQDEISRIYTLASGTDPFAPQAPPSSSSQAIPEGTDVDLALQILPAGQGMNKIESAGCARGGV